MADSDLDAALALFEEEIKDVPVAEEEESLREVNGSRGAGVSEQPDSDGAPPGLTKNPTGSGSGSPAASAETGSAAEATRNPTLPTPSEALASAPQPEWQRALQQRDALRMQEKWEAHHGGDPHVKGDTERVNDATTVGASSSTRQDEVGAARPSLRPEMSNVVLGAWVWDGWHWVWDPSAPSAANGSQVGGYAQSTVLTANDPSVSHPPTESSGKRKKHVVRAAAGNVWADPSLEEWPEDDFRIFVGDLAPDATEDELKEAFSKYASYNMSRVVVDKRTGEGKGYGFVSFAKGEDMVAALREMNGKYVGTRPVKLRKSDWQKRTLTASRRKDMKVFSSTGLVCKKRRHKH